MAEAQTTDSIPLITGSDGVMRVRGTRITLDTLVAAFDDGATAEEIVQQYPSASLAVIYQVIGYYLQHLAELEPTSRNGNEASTRPDELTNPSGRRTASENACLAVARGSLALKRPCRPCSTAP